MSEWSEPLRTVGLHRRRPDQLLSEAAELIIHGGELRLRQDAGLLQQEGPQDPLRRRVVQYCFKASFTQVFLCVHSWAFFIYTGCTGDPCICVQVVPFMSIGTQPLVPIWQLSKTHT